jgi:ribonuclease P protein component
VGTFSFSRSERLRNTADFDRVYSIGKRIASASLVLISDASPADVTRLGISVSRKIGKAVVRNRVKRLLREAFRLNKHRLKKGYDILLVARKGVEDLKFRQIEVQLLELCRRGGLLVQAIQNSRKETPADGPT